MLAWFAPFVRWESICKMCCVDDEGFEPSTFRMQNGRSTTELNAPAAGSRIISRRSSCSVVVSTPDLESGNPGSNPGRSVCQVSVWRFPPVTRVRSSVVEHSAAVRMVPGSNPGVPSIWLQPWTNPKGKILPRGFEPRSQDSES